jgi:CRP/FNR family cyclic AMP-dependent transcriptional regulator
MHGACGRARGHGSERRALYPHPVFFYPRSVPDDPLQKFAKTYAPGTVVFREGETGDEMYIIQRGKVRVSKDFSGKPHLIAVLEKGEFFGEMAIVSRLRRSATVTAIDEVEALAFDRDGLLKMITRNPRIGLSIIDHLCRRLQAAHREVQHLVQRDRPGLIALHLGHLFQELPGGASSLPLAATLDNASLAFELPLEEVRASVEAFAAEGILAIEEDRLTLADAGRLAALTGSGDGTSRQEPR